MENHWIRRIDFQKNLQKKLYPKLKVHIGSVLTNDILKEIETITVEYLTSEDYDFSCEVKVEVDGAIVDNIQVSIIKFIKLEIIDIL